MPVDPFASFRSAFDAFVKEYDYRDQRGSQWYEPQIDQQPLSAFYPPLLETLPSGHKERAVLVEAIERGKDLDRPDLVLAACEGILWRARAR